MEVARNVLHHLQARTSSIHLPVRNSLLHLNAARVPQVYFSSSQATCNRPKRPKINRPPFYENIFLRKHYETIPRPKVPSKPTKKLRLHQAPNLKLVQFGYVLLPEESQGLRFRTDDVCFIDKQQSERHAFSEALSALKAYDLFGGEHVSVVLSLNMDLDKMNVHPFKGLVNFPKSLQQQQVILVFAEGALAEEARTAGASIVGGEELVAKVENGELEFDHALCSLDFLPKIKHLPRILKAMMPNTRRGSATNDLAGTIPNYLSSEAYESNRFGSLTQVLGNTAFTADELLRNLNIIVSTVANHRHPAMATSKEFFKMASLEIPPGPRFNLHLNEVLKDLDQ